MRKVSPHILEIIEFDVINTLDWVLQPQFLFQSSKFCLPLFFLKSVIFFNKQQNQDFFKNKCGVVNSSSLLSVKLHRYLSFPNIKFCFYNFIYFIVFQYWFIFLISITFLKGQISYQINQIAIFLVSEIITH